MLQSIELLSQTAPTCISHGKSPRPYALVTQRQPGLHRRAVSSRSLSPNVPGAHSFQSGNIRAHAPQNLPILSCFLAVVDSRSSSSPLAAPQLGHFWSCTEHPRFQLLTHSASTQVSGSSWHYLRDFAAVSSTVLRLTRRAIAFLERKP